MASSLKTVPPDLTGNMGPRPSRRKATFPSFSRLRWKKAWRDLWLHKLRSVLVILSIAVGIFAFGIILGARSTITTELPIHYMSVVPPSATLHTSPINDAVVESIQDMPQIAVATGRQSTIVRFLNGEGEWENLQLFALEDYDNSGVNIIKPYQGAWPPGENEILIERNSLYLTGAGLDDELLLETSDGQQRALRLSGLVHDMNQLPAQITGTPYGYVSRDTLERLGLPYRMLWYQFDIYEVYLAQGRYQELIELTTAVLDATSGLEELYYYRGLAYQALGEDDAARTDFEAALDYNPAFEPARAGL